MIGRRERNEVDRVAGIDQSLCVAPELLVQCRARQQSLGCEPGVDHGRERRRVAQQLRDLAAWIGERRRADVCRAKDAHERAAHDAAERVPEVMNGEGIDAAGGPQAQVRHRAGERDEIRDAFAQVVARGQETRQVDEMQAGRIDHAVQHADVGPDAPPLVLGLGERDRSARWICSSGTPHLEVFAVAEEVGGGTEVVHDVSARRAGQPQHRLRVVRRDGRP